MGNIDLSSYKVTDEFFGAPYIDQDTERTEPSLHRMIHGGFAGTDTRFRFYFPPKDSGYEGRMLNPLSGAHGGTEDMFGMSAYGEFVGGLKMCLRLGAYMIESNQGHIGDEIDAKAGEDATLYGHRASAEVARFSKYVAKQIYGEPPHHSYVYGGSGGGRRSPLCLENAPGVWDGAMPFMGGGEIVPRGSTKRIKGAQTMSFASMFNVQRVLGNKLADVVDATAPGGSGDPFAGLTTHQCEELASLYRQGYPRGDEHMIGEQMGQIWLWTSIADLLYEQDPSYFENFWTKPGYVGYDHPEHVTNDIIDVRIKVTRVLTADDIVSSADFSTPEYAQVKNMAGIFATSRRGALPLGIEVKGLKGGYRLGAGVRVMTGAAAGRQLYCTTPAGDVLLCDGRAEANIARFRDVKAGDEIHIDNRRFLAFCYFARHHLMDEPQFDSFRLDGRPIYRQHEVPLMSPLMGVGYSGQFSGKLIWVHHTHDASLWPPQGVVYQQAVLASQGPKGAAERFRLRWAENAEHVPPFMLSRGSGRAPNTWLIDYLPVIEQTLADLIAWVERGVDPVPTHFEYVDGKVILPADATQRSGIQQVVAVTANGSQRAEVRVGEPVTLKVHTTMPPGAGKIIDVQWDFDGSGSFPFRHDGVGTATDLTLSTTHRYEKPGTYFATALVHSNREGNVDAKSRRIPNLASARIIVS